MIKLLKNKEVRNTLILQLVIATVGCVATFSMDNRAGIVVAIISAFLILIHYISTYERYHKIASLASDINSVLHGDNAISLENYTEGE